uniref:Uncharacterized protein n=1 Tax=Physcomitrium patens TaxID=3218 RepID=A0A2K1IMS5_PHYPA|nr:hypothetical protein PHYPA_026898 [Physcomitrium patens]
MALMTSRIIRKYASFYLKACTTDCLDSEWEMCSGARSRSSCTRLQRVFSNTVTHTHVPLSESPKRELKMKSATKAKRHQDYSKRQKKNLPKLLW